ncbi:MAG: hypothetical protein J5705_01470 [Bacteroidaceae bacterium]|nr:hypothetical protein [Bacteroidaceae bacterium]
MKKHIFKKSLTTASMLLVAMVSYAQSSSSGYFLEGYNQRYQLNPAFAPERSVFVAVPFLSNIQVDAQGNVGLSNFLYESKSKPGMLTTFMSSEVDKEAFLDALPNAAQFNVGVNLDVLAFGMGNKRWFTTFNLKLRNNERISIPKEMFEFMKSSLAEDNYMINDINVNSISYVEWSLTHSHKIGDNLTIGGGLKFIEGIAYADMNIDEIDARISDDAWKVKTNGTLRASIPGARFKYNSETNSLDGMENYKFKTPSSFGFAIDLGAEYDFKDLVKGLKVSAAITDLGFVSWGDMNTFATNNREYVTFEGFNNYDVNSDNNDDPMEKMQDDLNDMIRLYQTADNGKESIGLDATFRLGASYDMPMVDWLSFGQLFTARTGVYPYLESRTSVCMSPSSWFDATANLGFTSYGTTMGLLLNLHPKGVNFFLAVDRLKAEFNPQFIPVNDFGLNFSLGLNLAFGTKGSK